MYIKRQKGISFIEMILSLVIVSITFTGTLQIFGTLLNWSAYPFIEKQAIAIAQTILEDVAEGSIEAQEGPSISHIAPFYRDATQHHFAFRLKSSPITVQGTTLQRWDLSLQHNQGDEFKFSRLLKQ